MSPTAAQVEIIVYKIVNKEHLFLLAKRIPEKGGFWQPITGGVNKNESLISAAKRELFEETQIKDYLNFLNDVYYFEFNFGDVLLKEYVFGVEVGRDVDAALSHEHSEKKWCALNEALQLLKYDTNKEAFKKLHSRLMAKN